MGSYYLTCFISRQAITEGDEVVFIPLEVNEAARAEEERTFPNGALPRDYDSFWKSIGVYLTGTYNDAGRLNDLTGSEPMSAFARTQLGIPDDVSLEDGVEEILQGEGAPRPYVLVHRNLFEACYLQVWHQDSRYQTSQVSVRDMNKFLSYYRELVTFMHQDRDFSALADRPGAKQHYFNQEYEYHRLQVKLPRLCQWVDEAGQWRCPMDKAAYRSEFIELAQFETLLEFNRFTYVPMAGFNQYTDEDAHDLIQDFVRRRRRERD